MFWLDQNIDSTEQTWFNIQENVPISLYYIWMDNNGQFSAYYVTSGI